MKFDLKQIKFFVENEINKDIIDWRDKLFIDPFYFTILSAEKYINGKDIKLYLNKNSPVVNYIEYIKGDKKSMSTVPIRIISQRLDNDRFTREIVNLLNLDFTDYDDKEFFRYIISELINNAIDHGQSEVVASAQVFPNINEIEITVVDKGLGIYKTISRKYKVKNVYEAIEKALEKGVSGAIDYVYGTGHRNAGMGLYIVSKMVKDASGRMLIISDDIIYVYPDKNIEKLNSPWKGTIVSLRFNLSDFKENVLDYGFQLYLKMTISEDIDDEIF